MASRSSALPPRRAPTIAPAPILSRPLLPSSKPTLWQQVLAFFGQLDPTSPQIDDWGYHARRGTTAQVSYRTDIAMNTLPYRARPGFTTVALHVPDSPKPFMNSDKPLPPSPRPARSLGEGLGTEVRAPGMHTAVVNLSFLAPLERGVLRLIQQVTAAGDNASLLLSEAEIVIQTDPDGALALRNIHSLTKDVPAHERSMMYRVLERNLGADHRSLLQRLLAIQENDTSGDQHLEQPRKQPPPAPPRARFTTGPAITPSSPPPHAGILVHHDFQVQESTQVQRTPHLRGGGGGDDDNTSSNRRDPPKSHFSLTNFVRDPPRQADQQRPHGLLWWFAGGRRRRDRNAPTVGELRERRKAEERNGEVVGCWGTVMGIRRLKGIEGGLEKGKGEEGVE